MGICDSPECLDLLYGRGVSILSAWTHTEIRMMYIHHLRCTARLPSPTPTQMAVVVQLTGFLMLYTVARNTEEMDKPYFSRNKEIIKESLLTLILIYLGYGVFS